MRLMIALAALEMAGAALAQPADPETARPNGSAVADDEVGSAAPDRRYDAQRIVCKRTRPRTGSRVVRDRGDTRICQTMAEWDRQGDLGREALAARDRGTCGSGGCTIGR